MKWYSSYLEILRLASQIPEEEAGQVYAIAFNKLSEYGLAERDEDGRLTISNEGLIYSLNIPENPALDIAQETQSPTIIAEDEGSEASFVMNQDGLNDDSFDIVTSQGIAEIANDVVVPPKFDDFNDEQDAVESSSEKEVTFVDEQGSIFEDDNKGIDDNSLNPFNEVPSNPFEDTPPNPFEDTLSEPNPFSESNPFEDSSGNVTFLEDNTNSNEESLAEVEDDFDFTDELFGDEEEVEQSQLDENISQFELEIEPEDLPAPELPTFLENKDFTLIVHTVATHDLSEQASFIISPLRLDLPKAPSLIHAKINGNTFVVTTDEYGHIEFETDDYRYVIDCEMVDGEFKATVDLPGADLDNFKVGHRSFGDKGHIALVDEDEGVKIHIVPTSFTTNPAYGTADFMYCIEDGKGEPEVGSNNGEKSAIVAIDDEEYELIAKWNEKTLYAKIEPLE